MGKSKKPGVPSTSQVERASAGRVVLRTYYSSYRHQYTGTVEFDGAALRLHGDSWTWGMLEDLLAFHNVEGAAPEAKAKQLAAALKCLGQDRKARVLLDLLPHEVTVARVKALFRASDQLVLNGKFEGAGGPRAMGTFRTFVYERAEAVALAEQIDEQTVRFKPRARVLSDPRALISDLTDIAGEEEKNPPIGATLVKSAVDLSEAIRVRATSDLDQVRKACIREMEIAAAVRERVKGWNRIKLDPRYEEAAAYSLCGTAHPERAFDAANVPAEARLPAILQGIEKQRLADKNAPHSYCVCSADELRAQLFAGFPIFRSHRIFEIAQHACPEEVFAAVHLLQTYTGWNFSSVMALTVDRVEINGKSLIIQGYKQKTDDDTPEVEIPLTEPGVSMAIELLLWNRKQMILLGHLNSSVLDLWAVVRAKPSNQAAHTFHPAARLSDLQERHGLPAYSLDQIRTQFLFILTFAKGGIRAAQALAGHEWISTTGGYVENIIQDRISSSMNLAFTKELESEVVYVHKTKTKNLHSLNLKLLQPIGDGTSCANPNRPPPGRSRQSDSCDGQRCHVDGGCPNRRIVIDGARIEELVRTRVHYQSSWQLAWQSNPDRFAKQQLPAILVNEALYQVVSAGPFAARVHRVMALVKQEMSDGPGA